MKIVLLEGFGSSAIFQPPYEQYMGGAEMRAQLEDADVVLATWPPEDRPIVLRAPDDVEIVGVTWKWHRPVRTDPSQDRNAPVAVPSVTAQEMHDGIIGKIEARRADR